jgi:hypothetical protein
MLKNADGSVASVEGADLEALQVENSTFIGSLYDNSIKNKLNPSPEMLFPFVEFTVEKDVEPWKRQGNGGVTTSLAR